MGDAAAAEILEAWPKGKPIGLLALSPGDPSGWAKRASNDPAVEHWWDCVAEYMFAGPGVEAPFRRALMLEVDDAAHVAPLVADLSKLDESGRTTVLTASPMPRFPRTVMKAVSGLLRQLPGPRVPKEAPEIEAPLGSSDVNPSREQIERFRKAPGQPPVMVLNLNLHKRQGVDPDTGEPESGRKIADKYFRRGIRTFSRLGARAVSAGACRGALVDGLGVGRFDQIALVRYAARDDFAKLLRIGNAEGSNRYRAAGLDRSWVVHCRVAASSEARDL